MKILHFYQYTTALTNIEAGLATSVIAQQRRTQLRSCSKTQNLVA